MKIALGTAIVVFSCGVVFAAEQTITGVISDSKCGAKHGMANMTDRVCTQTCTAQGAQYVLASDGKLYKLTNRAGDLRTHAGHTVKLTGDIKGDTMKVSKVEMLKE